MSDKKKLSNQFQNIRDFQINENNNTLLLHARILACLGPLFQGSMGFPGFCNLFQTLHEDYYET